MVSNILLHLATVDVHDVESEPSSSEDEAGPATPGGSGLGTPLSKKARARRRATERRQARKLGISLDQVSESPQSNNPPAPLTPPQAETQSEPTYAQVAEPEKPAATNVSEEPKQKQAHIPEVNVPNSQPLLQLEPAAQIQTRGQLTEADAEVSSVTSSSSDSEDEPLPAPSEEKSLGTERRIESPQTPRRNKSREQAPPSKDHQPGSKWRSIITRTIWTFIMVGGFISKSSQLFVDLSNCWLNTVCSPNTHGSRLRRYHYLLCAAAGVS